jgi:hypothetical protein
MLTSLYLGGSIGHQSVVISHRNQSINRKGTYILADIHDMDHVCPKLEPPPHHIIS